ncbi:MAG: Rne/Rng family ribonuclease [Planctomycetes bacterium]|nr:Rne/Rng family ribonuclease [Planctomycetota bacterium]
MKRMLVNVAEGEEIRIAITENAKLVDYMVEHKNLNQAESVGNIFKGVVQNVEPAIQAAFIDIGLEKNGFLHASDVLPTYGERWKKNGDISEVSNYATDSRSHKDMPKIQNVLKKGQEVLVQITRAQLGNKGPTLSTFLSIPGRYIVLMPNVAKVGVSRKIEDHKARKDLSAILDEIVPTSEMGFIARTAAMGQNHNALKADLNYLMKLWRIILQRIKSMPSPALVFEEADVIIRSIRDSFKPDIDEIIIDKLDSFNKVYDFIRAVIPEFKDRVQLYEELEPLFYKHGIEKEVEKLFDKKVLLPSGGFLFIEQTEAMVTIDVNSGKNTRGNNPEKLALITNVEAAHEICRQLKLRDLGGLVVSDFIDMKLVTNKKSVENALRNGLRNDKAKSKICRTSPLGLIEIARQRLKDSNKRTLYQPCKTCSGTGWVKSLPISTMNIFRKIKHLLAQNSTQGVTVEGPAQLIEHMQNKHRKDIIEIEQNFKKKIELKFNANLPVPEIYTHNTQGRIVKSHE